MFLYSEIKHLIVFKNAFYFNEYETDKHVKQSCNKKYFIAQTIHKYDEIACREIAICVKVGTNTHLV